MMKTCVTLCLFIGLTSAIPQFPGKNIFGPPRNRGRERCPGVCIPANQKCDSSILQQMSPEEIPSEMTDNFADLNTGRGVINFRIVNTDDGPCQRDEVCCSLISSVKNVTPEPVKLAREGCGTRTLLTNNAPFGVADFGEYPWFALVLSPNDEYLAGGALIDPEWVLTVGHRTFNISQAKVRLGEYDVTTEVDFKGLKSVDIPVSEIIVHPQFHQQDLRFNLALLRLSRPVNIHSPKLPHINTVCLPESTQTFNSQICYLSGFGTDDFEQGSFQTILKEVDLPIVDPFRCQEQLRQTVLGADFSLDRESFICAGGEFGRDACTGDGGSPLVCVVNGRFQVAGLVSWGIGCAQQDVPGVYTNVASFRNFIEQTTNLQFPIPPHF